MLILLTNDDGIYAPGVLAMRRELAALGSVELIAPLVERSGTSHSVSIDRPLRMRPVYLNDDLIGHSINGTPADCVKVGLSEHLDRLPDLLVAGINLGQNAGVNVLYSGTVAAALEGAMLGVPSMAVSLDTREHPDFDAAARIALALIQRLQSRPLPPRTMWNINLPALPESEIKGVRLTRQSLQAYTERYERRVDPRREAYYWIDGRLDRGIENHGSDLAALRDGYISVSPLSYDLTSREDVSAFDDLFDK